VDATGDVSAGAAATADIEPSAVAANVVASATNKEAVLRFMANILVKSNPLG
jgi:hypothetical protein